MLQTIDPNTGAPYPAEGTDGALVFTQPDSGGVITPSDIVIYDPPVTIWVGDTGSVNVTVVPYGRDGDKTVTYPVSYGMTIPVVCRQVLATGTTATALFMGSALSSYSAGGGGPPPAITADSGTITADSSTITADNG